MPLNFDKYVSEGNKFLNDLALELNHPNERDKAGRKLRAVMHALRDQLTIEESLHMLSQMPFFLKAVYVENWEITETKSKARHLKEFLTEIRRYGNLTAKVDFKDDSETEEAALAVFRCLGQYVSDGEMKDVQAILPTELKYLIEVNHA